MVLSALSLLELELLSGIPYPLALVRIRFAQSLDGRGQITHLPLVPAEDHDAHLRGSRDRDALRHRHVHLVGEAQSEHELLLPLGAAFHARTEADAHQLQLFPKALRDAPNRAVEHAPSGAPHGLAQLRCPTALHSDKQLAHFLLDRAERVQWHAQAAKRTVHNRPARQSKCLEGLSARARLEHHLPAAVARQFDGVELTLGVRLDTHADRLGQLDWHSTDPRHRTRRKGSEYDGAGWRMLRVHTVQRSPP
eukprot:CAMPEP_0119377972 /NCGR_PEP_ID=MMETSP1334-20130426/47328_1 /TAXON_ID=127549 /ORGANISM="Calcidiscus leptoporus, Strain RCC1130" /LENGTH=250 /DNA_ID=CAMNT_0007397059 /DNA_START=183 /DNA_END=931 /DNA_ORIENTATION=-